MMKKNFVYFLLVLIPFLIAGCGSSEANEEVSILRTHVVERGNLRELVNITGTIESERKASIPFLTSGTLSVRFVENGDYVHEAEPLLSIDTTSLEMELRDAEIAVQLQQIALEELRAGPSEYDIAAAMAAIARSQAQLNQITQPPDETAVRLAQANLDIARSNYWVALNDDGYTQQLDLDGQEAENTALGVNSSELAMNIALQELANVQQGASSEQVAVAQAAVYQAQATLDSLLGGITEYDLRIAELQIELAEAALGNARNSLEDAIIRAPFDGVVAGMDISVGEQITPGMPVVTVMTDDKFFIDTLVDELDIPQLKNGQLAFLTLDAFPEVELCAHVDRIAPDAVIINGIASYQVRLSVDHTDVPLKDGMTAVLDIIISELTDVILVPNWAIRFDRETGNAYVNISNDQGNIEEVRIQVGTRGAEYSEVIDGLQEGASVILINEDTGLGIFGE